jgi:formylglycine-generating enzyme required for sulfatase activity
VDKYEASVWLVPKRGNHDLIEKIQRGRVKLGELTNGQAVARRVAQLGTSGDDYDPAGCPDTGSGCENVYAASIPGVIPARFITWFQAQQACMNAGKRLLTNAEWQGAVAGTPDGVPCTVDAAGPGFTGTAGCASRWDVRDMVGNVSEWVADWVQGNNGSSWSPTVDPNNLTSGTYGDDLMWGTNPAEFQGGGQNFPAALVRGGDFRGQTGAGVFALFAIDAPSFSFDGVGFRCGR